MTVSAAEQTKEQVAPKPRMLFCRNRYYTIIADSCCPWNIFSSVHCIATRGNIRNWLNSFEQKFVHLEILFTQFVSLHPPPFGHECRSVRRPSRLTKLRSVACRFDLFQVASLACEQAHTITCKNSCSCTLATCARWGQNEASMK